MKHFSLLCVLTIFLGFALSACCNKAFCADLAKKQVAELPAVLPADSILTRLPNGLLVCIFKDKRFPLVGTRLYVRVGSADEPPAQAGISHVLEHMVFKGTDHRPRGQVAKDVEALGGYLNAATSFDKTWYITDMPAAHWRTGMDVVRDMAFQATLDPKELESEKNVVISELERGEDSPTRKLYENLQVAALKNTPYGRPIIGFKDTIRAITVADLRAWISHWYQPQNMMLLVGGDIEPAEVLEHAQKIFGDLKNHSDLAERGPLNLVDAAKGSKPVEITRGPWNKVYLGIAMPAPALRDLRSIDLDVLCYLLGGDGTSAFYQKYKYDLQLVENIDVGNMSLARAGLLTITARLDADKVEKFWNLFTKDLASLTAKNFSDASLERAKFNLEDSMDRAGETLDSRISWRGSIEFDLGGALGEKNIRFTQRNVDFPQLQSSIKTWFDSTQARVRVLAPDKAALPDFEAVMAANWPAAASNAESMDKAQTAAGQREVVDLGNGCTVILLPDRSAPYMSLDLLMPGGNSLLKPDQQGLATLTASLLTDGAGDYSKPAMERWLAERAAGISARAGLQTFGISLTGPARFNQDYFKMLHDVLRRPKFAPEEFTREVENMKAAIKQRNDQPLSFMFARLNPFLFPDGQPYGYDSLGSEKTIGTFNVMSVRDFWTIQGSMPWTLAIAGDFNKDDVLKFVRGLPAPHAKGSKLNAPAWGGTHTLALTLPGRNQAHLLQVFKTVPANHPDAPALMLLQNILSGQSGILFSELRDKEGLGYTVTAFNRLMPLTGMTAFYIGTTPDKIEQAREGFSRIINRLKVSPLDEDMLKAGANSMLGDYLRERQSLASRAGEAATDSVLNYPPDFQKQLIERAQALKPSDLQTIAKKYFIDAYDVTLKP